MSKKVLIISTSPRKGGNSERLADAFLGCFPKARIAGTVFAGGVDIVGAINGHPSLDQSYKMGSAV